MGNWESECEIEGACVGMERGCWELGGMGGF